MTRGPYFATHDALTAVLRPDFYMPLDRVFGVSDVSGNGRDGTSTGGLSPGTSADSALGVDAPPGAERSTIFDGVDDRVNNAFVPFANGTPLWMAGMAKRTSSAAAHTLFGSAAAAGSQVVCRLQSGSNDFFFGPQGATTGTITWTDAWPGNALWAFWVLLFDEPNDSASLYIDGDLISTQATTRQFAASPLALRVGVHSGSNNDPFLGNMAHVLGGQRTLTGGEIATAFGALTG